MSRRRALLAALLPVLLVLPLAPHAQDIEVLPLRHRGAEQVLPLLRPLVEPGGALTGRGYQRYRRASPTNRRQLREVLATVDVPPRQLLISVSQERIDHASRGLRSADGSLGIGTRGIRGQVNVQANNANSVSTQDATQRIRVREGASA
jgi:hypothetical protein